MKYSRRATNRSRTSLRRRVATDVDIFSRGLQKAGMGGSDAEDGRKQVAVIKNETCETAVAYMVSAVQVTSLPDVLHLAFQSCELFVDG